MEIDSVRGEDALDYWLNVAYLGISRCSLGQLVNGACFDEAQDGIRVVDVTGVQLCFSSRRRHTRCSRDWSSDVCSSDLFARPQAPLTPRIVRP